MARGLVEGTPTINQIHTEKTKSSLPPLATSNIEKIREFAVGLGLSEVEVRTISLHVDEIQDASLENVVRAKAIAAYEAAKGQPVIVEDTALTIHELTDICKPPFVKFWAEDRNSRAHICRILDDEKRLAQAETIYAVYDGKEVHMRKGRVNGTIVKEPRGNPKFGWDDIFIPDGQDELEEGVSPRTFAEMSIEEKMHYSMRQEALEKLKEDPFALGLWVHAFVTGVGMENTTINPEFFKGPEMEKARKFAFALRSLKGIEPNENFDIDTDSLPPLHQVQLNDYVTQVTHDPACADTGVLTTEYDSRTSLDGKETRLMTDLDGNHTYLQHDKDGMIRALYSRALEYHLHHNPDMYAHLREFLKGKRTETRANLRSPVIEELLGLVSSHKSKKKNILSDGIAKFSDAIKSVVTKVPGFADLAYPRQYSDEKTSRTKSAMNHIINRNGVPTSIFALGGMPQVTGSRDVVVTAAIDFMQSFIPHNGLFIDFDRRVRLFKESRDTVKEMIPDAENQDIQDLAVAQIGVCLSGNNMETIKQQSQELMDEGCGNIRIYTTNPGPEVIDAAKTICKQAKKNHQGNLPFQLTVGPIVDLKQANKLRKIAKKHGVALTLLAGHGGGENCTSLEGGAAANAIELVYKMSLDKKFNDVAIGFEGGLGSLFGPWMGIIDKISKDGSLVRGGIETMGGVLLAHRKGGAVQPYHGSASPWTMYLEQVLFPHLVNRTDEAGRLRNNEGKPSYMEASHWASSITHHFAAIRSLFGRTLADQQAGSIDDIIKRQKQSGRLFHVAASASAKRTADEHRKVS